MIMAFEGLHSESIEDVTGTDFAREPLQDPADLAWYVEEVLPWVAEEPTETTDGVFVGPGPDDALIFPERERDEVEATLREFIHNAE